MEVTEKLSWMLGTNFILDTTLALESEFGKVVTANVEVWLRGGGNVAGETGREERLGWKAEAGIRYLFE